MPRVYRTDLCRQGGPAPEALPYLQGAIWDLAKASRDAACQVPDRQGGGRGPGAQPVGGLRLKPPRVVPFSPCHHMPCCPRLAALCSPHRMPSSMCCTEGSMPMPPSEVSMATPPSLRKPNGMPSPPVRHTPAVHPPPDGSAEPALPCLVRWRHASKPRHHCFLCSGFRIVNV